MRPAAAHMSAFGSKRTFRALVANPRLMTSGSGHLRQGGVVLVPFCIERGCHILKMLERDPRRSTLSAIVLLGF